MWTLSGVATPNCSLWFALLGKFLLTHPRSTVTPSSVIATADYRRYRRRAKCAPGFTSAAHWTWTTDFPQSVDIGYVLDCGHW